MIVMTGSRLKLLREAVCLGLITSMVEASGVRFVSGLDIMRPVVDLRTFGNFTMYEHDSHSSTAGCQASSMENCYGCAKQYLLRHERPPASPDRPLPGM